LKIESLANWNKAHARDDCGTRQRLGFQHSSIDGENGGTAVAYGGAPARHGGQAARPAISGYEADLHGGLEFGLGRRAVTVKHSCAQRSGAQGATAMRTRPGGTALASGSTSLATPWRRMNAREGNERQRQRPATTSCELVAAMAAAARPKTPKSGSYLRRMALWVVR